MTDKPNHSADGSFHRFAWDGLSFDVPRNWDLSEYTFRGKQSEVKMEDELGLRLELKWIRSRHRLDGSRVRARYEKASRELVKTAESRTEISDLGRGWTAFQYAMPEGRVLITAFNLGPRDHVFSFFCLHFENMGRRKPTRILRRLAESFTVETNTTIPWRVYDVSLDLHRDFKLVRTTFQAGRKLMVFQWRLRQLYVWQFSLADILLKNRSPAEWGAEFLNSFKEIRGPQFLAADRTQIHARRKWTHPVGHHDEIGRLCFRYRVVIHHNAERNTVLLSVFNFRREADLQKLEAFYRSVHGDGSR